MFINKVFKYFRPEPLFISFHYHPPEPMQGIFSSFYLMDSINFSAPSALQGTFKTEALNETCRMVAGESDSVDLLEVQYIGRICAAEGGS